MAEAERVLPGEVGPVRPDQLLARQREETARDVGAQSFRGQRRDRSGVEDLALHGAALDDCALLRVQPVQAGREQELDRRRNGHVREVLDRAPRAVLEPQQSVVDQHREHLLDEQRVALGRLEDPGPGGWRDLGTAEEVVHQRRRRLAVERLQQDRARVHLPARPPRADLEKLRARHAEEQERGVARPVGEVLDQVEEGRLGPVDVVEHHGHRPVAREVLEELADAPERLLGRDGLAPREEAGDQRHDPVGIVGAGRDPRELRAGDADVVGSLHAGRLLHHLGQRVERDALPVGQAPAPEEDRRGRRPDEELLDQARLPDAGGPEEREQVRGALGHHPLQGALEHLEFLRRARPSGSPDGARDRRCPRGPP